MSTRPIRNRKVLRLESLKVRNAPSHFGVRACRTGTAPGQRCGARESRQRCAHVSHVNAAAHVSHVNDSRSTDKYQTPEVKSGTDKSVDPTSSETNSPDPSSPDPNSVDPTGNR